MKEHALRTLRRAYGDDIQLLEIAWALTVPTGWSEASKQIMRLAAKSAGIVDNADSPEARHNSEHHTVLNCVICSKC